MAQFTIDAILGFTQDFKQKPKSPPTEYRPRSRRGRTAFNDTAISRLEHVFMVNRYPDIVLRESLALQLGVAESRIQVWFQNRRSRSKRNKHRSQDSSFSSTGSTSPPTVRDDVPPYSPQPMMYQSHNLPGCYPTSHYQVTMTPQYGYYPHPFPGQSYYPVSMTPISPGYTSQLYLPTPYANHVSPVFTTTFNKPTLDSTPSSVYNIPTLVTSTPETLPRSSIKSESFTELFSADLRQAETLNDTTLSSVSSVNSARSDTSLLRSSFSSTEDGIEAEDDEEEEGNLVIDI